MARDHEDPRLTNSAQTTSAVDARRPTRWTSRVLLQLAAGVQLGLLAACVATNPDYDAPGSRPADSDDAALESSGAGGTGPGSGAEGADTESGSSMSSAGGDNASSDSASPAGASAGDSSTGSATSTSGGGMAETEADAALQPSELGQACAQSSDCQDLGVGAVCCEAKQCADTCMVACETVTDCPFEGMGCEHGFCLFPCGDDDGDDGGDDDDGDDDGGAEADADCSDWPGFTCQHGMRFCEND